MDRPSMFSKYLATRVTPIEQVRLSVWNSPDNSNLAAGDKEFERTAVLEQYKMYVEMADRISARRSLTNTFFLSLNTAIFAAIASRWTGTSTTLPWFLVFPLLALVTQCFAWFFLVRSYRQLNSAKYTVIGVLEDRLPASPYWRAEWAALGEGKDKRKYWPMTHLEQWIPILFALTYVGGFIAAVVS